MECGDIATPIALPDTTGALVVYCYLLPEGLLSIQDVLLTYMSHGAIVACVRWSLSNEFTSTHSIVRCTCTSSDGIAINIYHLDGGEA